MNGYDAEHSYRNDAEFKLVVDTMMSLLVQARLTPYEMRAAAILACTHYEAMSIRPRVVCFQDVDRLYRHDPYADPEAPCPTD